MNTPRWLRATVAAVIDERAADIELEQAVEREVFDNGSFWFGQRMSQASQTSGGGVAGGSSAAADHVTRRGAQ